MLYVDCSGWFWVGGVLGGLSCYELVSGGFINW